MSWAGGRGEPSRRAGEIADKKFLKLISAESNLLRTIDVTLLVLSCSFLSLPLLYLSAFSRLGCPGFAKKKLGTKRNEKEWHFSPVSVWNQPKKSKATCLGAPVSLQTNF